MENRSAVGIEFANYPVNKTDTNVLITLLRTGSLASQVSVNYATVNGSAVSPADYRATNGTVIFPVNVSTKTVLVRLGTNAAGAVLIPVTNTTITILDSNSGVSIVNLGAPVFTANKTNANAVVTLTRTGGLLNESSVTIATADGTAFVNGTYGSDYTAINRTVTFRAGSNSLTALIPLVNNPYGGMDIIGNGSNRWFTCTISNPQGCQLGTTAGARVDILDTLAHGTVQFSAANYTNSAAGGSAGIIAVYYAMFKPGDTAVPPADYDASVSDCQIFNPGATTHTVTVPLHVHGAAYPKKASLYLNTPVFGATLGTISNAVLTITP